MSAGQIGNIVSNRPIDTAYAVNKFVKDASPKALRRLRRIALSQTDSRDIYDALKARDAAQEEAKAAQAAAARAKAKATAKRQYELIVEAHEEKSTALRAEQRAASDVIRELEAMPKTHSAAALRIAGTPDLDGLKATVQQHINHRTDTVATLKARYEQVRKAGDMLRMLGILPGNDNAQVEGATRTGLRLCLGDEEAIGEAAEERAAAWLAAYSVSPGWPKAEVAEPWLQAQRECPRWNRRDIRRDVRGAQAWLDCALRMARPESPAVSRFTLSAWQQVQERGKAWSEGMSVRFEDGQEVPLSDIQARSRRARKAQMYAVVKGMEWEGDRLGYQAFFLTLTLPGSFHPYTSGQRAKDGSYPNARPNPDWNPAHGPKAQWDELQGRWELVRARLADHHPLRAYMGVTVPEPHKDGTPHMHAMLWLPRVFQEGDRTRQTTLVLKDVLNDVAPGRQSKLEIVRKRPDKTMPDGTVKRFASPSTYVMKYVLKSLDDEATAEAGGEAYERHRAWTSSRGIRRMRLVGVHGSLRIWQRLWTSQDDEDLPPAATDARAAMRRCAAAGDLAAAAEEGSPERAAAKLAQSEAAADALRHLGALPGATRRLKLGYEDAVTEYGQPTKRPCSINEESLETRVEEFTTPKRKLPRTRTVSEWIPTGGTMPLKRQQAELVSTNDGSRNTLTVGAIVPRAGAAPQPQADPEDLRAADDLEKLIQMREGQPIWLNWCADKRQRVHRLRYPPPDDPANDKSGDTEIASQAA